MEIVIIRHAIASERDPLRWPDDRQRPLTPEGERRFRKAARAVARLVPRVDALLSSPWKRAWQTAEILSKECGWPAAASCEALEGDRNPRGLLSVLRDNPAAARIALVGHEPQLQRLTSYLLTGDAERVSMEFKKGAAALLAVSGVVRAGTAELLWLVPPRLLRSLA